jgi:3-hydroxyisobutyrate dehydrogenase-like beta-hydroxyacid dehydrogenase
MKKIGFIGLGLMGNPMAKNFFKKGFPLIVYNRTPKKTEEFKEMGISIASTPAELAERSDVVITIVKDHIAVEEVLIGENGAFKSARPGTVFIDMSTILPKVSIRLAEKAEEIKCHFLDAPVSGSTWAAEKGTLAIMVGGEKVIFEENLQIFNAVGSKVIYMGPKGSGSYAKLINNLIGATFAAVLAEGISFGEKAGLNISNLIEVLASGAYKSPLIEFKGPKIMKKDYSTQFSLNLMFKDLNYMLETAKEMNFPLFLGSITKEIYQATRNIVDGELDYSIIAEFFRKLV